MSPSLPVPDDGAEGPLYIVTGFTAAQEPLDTTITLPLSEEDTDGGSLTVMLIDFPLEAFVVKESTVAPFFCMVIVELLTVGIVGVPIKSLYVPVFATLWSVMLPLIDSEELVLCAVVAVVFKVPGADGIDGVPIKSEYVPVFATLCNVILPLIASPLDADCAVVAFVISVPGAEGIVAVIAATPFVTVAGVPLNVTPLKMSAALPEPSPSPK